MLLAESEGILYLQLRYMGRQRLRFRVDRGELFRACLPSPGSLMPVSLEDLQPQNYSLARPAPNCGEQIASAREKVASLEFATNRNNSQQLLSLARPARLVLPKHSTVVYYHEAILLPQTYFALNAQAFHRNEFTLSHGRSRARNNSFRCHQCTIEQAIEGMHVIPDV